MKQIAALLAILLVCLKGQTPAKDAASAQAKKNDLTTAASAGTPLPATINVSDNVNIEAVMLPWDISRRVFGKEVADNYAVIEVNISNRSKDAGLVIQSLFIDLHDWGLAGPAGLGTAGLARSAPSKSFQAKASPLEVSSVEYRIVRGGLLDRQPWTNRNVGLRIIQVMGSLGTAFAFPFSKDVVAGIGAWNGGVVPGFQALFPDGTQAQMDRISDYGFRNNKIIPQQAADIVVAFFPIRRFLTPTLQKVFLQTPSLFFNPVLMVLDPATRKLLDPILMNVFGTKAEVDKQFKEMLDAYGKLDQVAVTNARDQLEQDTQQIAAARETQAQAQSLVDLDKASAKADAQHSKALDDSKTALADLKTAQKKDQKALEDLLSPISANLLFKTLGTLSLNNVNIVVSGIMTVDVDSIPSVISSIECTNDSQPALIWAAAGDQTCAIRGSFLSGGTPVIAEASALGLTVGAVTAGSTDSVLNMKLTLKSPVPPKTVLTFTVTKKNKAGNTVESMKFPYTVPDYTLGSPAITGVTVKDTTVTVAGTNFFDTTSAALSVIAHPVTPTGLTDQKIDKPTHTATQIQFDDRGYAPACWQVQVKVGTAQAHPSPDKPPKDQFAIAPAPKVDSATLSGTTLTIAGTQLVDLAECGVPLTFETLSDATGAKPQTVSKPVISADGKQATLTPPTLASGAKWKEVQILLNGKQVATTAITTK